MKYRWRFSKGGDTQKRQRSHNCIYKCRCGCEITGMGSCLC